MGQILDKARAARDALAAARSTSTPSNVTETQAFKAWFGDSKVVDAQGRPLVVFHGTDAAAFAEFKIPAFFTSDRHGADWYMRGEEGRVEELYLSIRKPFDIRTQAGAYDFITLARQAGVEVNSDIERERSGGPWMFEADEVAKHSPYDGTNVPDLIYIPAVRTALQAQGYDGLLVSDTLENGEIPVWVALRADQIRRVAVPGLLDDANLSAMERVRIAAQIAQLIARFKDAGTGMRARLKAAQELRVLIGRLASAPSIVADEHPALAKLRRLVIAKYKDVFALREALDEIGDAITELSAAGAFDASAADVANEAITTWAQAEEQEKEGAAE